MKSFAETLAEFYDIAHSANKNEKIKLIRRNRIQVSWTWTDENGVVHAPTPRSFQTNDPDILLKLRRYMQTNNGLLVKPKGAEF